MISQLHVQWPWQSKGINTKKDSIKLTWQNNSDGEIVLQTYWELLTTQWEWLGCSKNVYNVGESQWEQVIDEVGMQGEPTKSYFLLIIWQFWTVFSDLPACYSYFLFFQCNVNAGLVAAECDSLDVYIILHNTTMSYTCSWMSYNIHSTSPG